MMDKIKLFEDMKTMSKDELLSYMTSVNATSWICDIAGVSFVMLSLMYPSLITFAATGFVFWLFGGMAVGATHTRNYINKLLETKFKDK